MGAQQFRSFFLSAIAFCALCYSGYTLWETWNYLRLDSKTKLQEIGWEIVTTDEETHQLRAHYVFSVNGSPITGSHLFKKPIFINSLGAEHAIGEFTRIYDNGWFASSDPHYSSLVKYFPTKELIYTTILWGLLIYFITLRNYCDSRN